MPKLNHTHDEEVLKLWEAGFIKLPRYISDNMVKGKPAHRKMFKLYFILYCYCYYQEGFVKLDTYRLPCRRGEFVGKLEKLSGMLDIPVSSIWRMLQQLEARRLITTQRIKGGIRIYIYGYCAFNPLDIPQAKVTKPSVTPQESMRIYEEGLRQGRVLTAAQIQRIYEEEKSRND